MFKQKLDGGKSENGPDNDEKQEKKSNDANKIESQDKDSDDDLEMTFGPYIEDRLFNPINRIWQRKQGKTLNLKITHWLNFKQEKKVIGKPSTMIPIIGDGNCYYRSLSYCITGTEDQHLAIRILIAEVI